MTLTISPGVTIKFSGTSTKLWVNGTLTAVGTPTNKIIFTRSGTSGSWGGIRFENSSVDASCKVQYADITYADYGIYCNWASPKIWNNTISNCNYGIYAYYSNPSVKSNKLIDNTIYLNNSSPYLYNNLSTQGRAGAFKSLFAYRSSPYLERNTLKGQEILEAVFITYYSSPRFGADEGTEEGYNCLELDYGDWVMWVSDHSTPFLGGTDDGLNRMGGYNTVRRTSTQPALVVVSDPYSSVTAHYNWWGQYPVSSSLFHGNVDYSYPLSSPPPVIGSNLSKGLAEGSLAETSQVPDSTTASGLWKIGRNHQYAKQPLQALRMYKKLIDQHPSSREAHYALVQIFDIYQILNLNGLTGYFEGLTKSTRDEELKAAVFDLLTSAYMLDGNVDRAVQTSQLILNRSPGSRHEYTALFNLFNIYNIDLNDQDQADAILTILKEKYQDYELTLAARSESGENVSGVMAKKFGVADPVLAKELQIPVEYALGSNYPNPFNPSTTITYDLPEDAKVRMVVYNIMGQEVVRLVDDFANAGYHQVVWNGKDANGVTVPSGVYIYSMQSKAFSESKKMVLLK